jgi:hypothetical protein
MDKSMKSVDKCWDDSLSFMDNIYVKVVLYVVLILFSSTYFENINMYFANLHKNYKFLNIVVLLLIVYLGRACPVIGILLGISYVISLNYMSSKENFFPSLMNNNYNSNESFVGDVDDSGDDSAEAPMNGRPMTSDKIEEFFPGLINKVEKEEPSSFDEMKKDSSDCKSLYTPEFESVGDVCNTVNTFNDELNAQGLNSPEGFNSNVFGSPL